MANGEALSIDGTPRFEMQGLMDYRPERQRSCPRSEMDSYIANNQAFIPNYGERYRQGDRISTGFVESAVNYVVAKRFTKRQQMQWSPKGAHLLLQMRTRVLNGELEQTFRDWHPGFRAAGTEGLKKAA